MAYYFYLGNVLLPIPPSKLELKISNNNKTYNLINYSQINVLKNPGLSSLEFEVVLPNTKYPFAMYKNNFQNANTITDTTEEGFDTKVKIKLKQYKEYSTKKVQVTIKQYRPPAVTRTVTTNNTAVAKPSGQNYTVKRGDCLWNIAKRFYGNGAKYTTIYNANRSKIRNTNLIYPGQVLWIPS